MQVELLAALFEQAPDALVYCDLDGRVRLWNAAAAALFGHSAATALGQSLDMIIPERFRAAHWAGFHHAVATGEEKYRGRVMTTRAVHADGGKCYVDMGFALIRDDAGAVQGVLAVVRPNAARNAAAS